MTTSQSGRGAASGSTLEKRREVAAQVNTILAERYPHARCALNYSTPLELLVATVLSAQSTDQRVNQITPMLFTKYPDAEAYASADREELEAILLPLGFFRVKAESLRGIGAALVSRYHSEVPSNYEALVSLPGVGRKTAHVVLGNAFGVPGITVDTHVGRVARRIGWTTETDPLKAERDIARLFPPAEWTMLSHRLIFHGRTICHSRLPACAACPVAGLCPSSGEGIQDPAVAATKVKEQP